MGLQNTLTPVEREDNILVAVLDDIVEKAEDNKILVINPLDQKERDTILK